jgi:hypothetical protein
LFKAEARLAARRQARAEAREIRMREIERQQKEAEENADKAFDMHAAGKFIITFYLYICVCAIFFIRNTLRSKP